MVMYEIERVAPVGPKSAERLLCNEHLGGKKFEHRIILLELAIPLASTVVSPDFK